MSEVQTLRTRLKRRGIRQFLSLGTEEDFNVEPSRFKLRNTGALCEVYIAEGWSAQTIV
jgi:hypothetical protein